MTMTCPAHSMVAALLIAFLVSQPALPQRAQKGDEDTLRISSELVQVDVLVTDRDGTPVRGLKREDFELLDNNKRQEVTFFNFEEVGAPPRDGVSDAARQTPRELTSRELRRVLAFVVDTLHMDFASLYRTRKLLEDFVEQKMQPGDLVLILPSGGGSGVYQQFTSDKRILRRAIERLRPATFSAQQFKQTVTSSPLQPPSMIGGRAGLGRLPGQIGSTQTPEMRQAQLMEEFDTRATLGLLRDLTREMRRLPGRKIGIVVSEGFRITQTQIMQEMSETTALAARANVIFYTIDPRGLEVGGLTAADDLSGQDPAEVLSQRNADRYDAEGSLFALAADTGGKFFHSSNDLRRGVTQLLAENSAWYLLGFQPQEEKWDGKFHKLKVTVRGRSDLKVTMRRGYWARDEKPSAPVSADPKVTEIVEAIRSPLVRRDIDLQLTPFYKDDAQREPILTTLVHLDVTRLSFKKVEDRYQDKVEMVGFVYDAAGKPVDRFSNTVDMNLRPQTYENARKYGFVTSRTMKLKPGIYQIKMLVREEETGLTGTVSNFIEVPAMKGDRLALSSILIDSRVVENGQVVEAGGEHAGMSQRHFKRGGQFNYLLVVYNAKGEGKDGPPQLEMKTRVLGSTKPAFEGQPHAASVLQGSTPPSRVVTGGLLRLGQLPPGNYTLEVTIIDKLRKKVKDAVVKQELDFTVEP